MQTNPTRNPDFEVLHALNRDYINSVQQSDVHRFDQILADDFTCSNPDGTLVDRAAFLQQSAKPPAISNLEAHDVDVRLLGEVAIIHARTTFTTPTGQPGAGRYTDVWARRNDQWLAVSAHVTRCRFIFSHPGRIWSNEKMTSTLAVREISHTFQSVKNGAMAYGGLRRR